MIVGYSVDRDKDPLLDVETHTKTTIEWARLHGPFEGIGVIPTGVDTTVAGYAIKRLAVTAQGLNVATKVVSLKSAPPSPEEEAYLAALAA